MYISYCIADTTYTTYVPTYVRIADTTYVLRSTTTVLAILSYSVQPVQNENLLQYLVSIACIIIILEYVWFDYVMKQLSNCQFLVYGKIPKSFNVGLGQIWLGLLHLVALCLV